ncbi:TonB-dependent receptor plug domain-containing protein [Chitinophagaceae bacterium LB-8]|uniref:TonB-dependent receptor plug domain-containing protein n=1 Tax=Paraflavisolibacter caeni TaxID=2982496 RepID=A0A9X2Y1F3_9BACT|nr:TonB-dependent receptor plug domain-containing protein [Paraflavisolibacter caeni]MCU7552807.1 TonB-dependent receptor plug domain-containing protein [Paraflavisolibacter caeni]
MKKTVLSVLLLNSFAALAQQTDSTRYLLYDTVTISALRRQLYQNTPFTIQQVNQWQWQLTPRPLLMNQLSRLPSVSAITSGNSIQKPVIRGLSFNHIQLFAQGTRIENQTWDDRHDIGISENGFDRVEIISGPAALLYGPNAMGGAIVFAEQPSGINEKANGYVQMGYFNNSQGGNLSAGVRQGKEHLYYSLHTYSPIGG